MTDKNYKKAKQLVEFFSLVLGDKTEIVLHDGKTGEVLVAYNSHVTGRDELKIDNRDVMEMLAAKAEKNGDKRFLIGYKSRTFNKHNLVSSNFFCYDDNDEIEFVICVNRDVQDLINMQDLLNSMLSTVALREDKTLTEDDSEIDLDNFINDIVIEELENIKPMSLNSVSTKLEVISGLEDKGVFKVRGSVPKVCEKLKMSQASLYQYLKKIRTNNK